MSRVVRFALVAFALALFVPQMALADGGVCPRPPVGSEVQRPPDLYSQNGVLKVNLGYYTSVDDQGRTLFCFVTDDGQESPTLHVNPGETIKVHLTNHVPDSPIATAGMTMAGMTVPPGTQCGDATMTAASVNMHFHGTNTSPRCHSDEVVHTLVNSGESFDYAIKIPANEPPGLYWYHPHVHGISSPAVQGGASGLIEVEGIANLQPAVAGLPERYLVIRDEQLIGNLHRESHLKPIPNWDVSLNYVTVPFPDLSLIHI